MKKISITLLIATLAGCATHPDDMSTSYVSALKYTEYDCNQIYFEMTHINRKSQELYQILSKKSDNDSAQMAVGLVILWPALFFLEGGDGPQASEYARLKGEFEALHENAVYKKCNDILQSIAVAQQASTMRIKTIEASHEKPVSNSYCELNSDIPGRYTSAPWCKN